MKKERVIAENKEHLKKLIDKEIASNGLNCDLNNIEVSLVEDMSGLFYKSKFNGDISQWDVSNVRDMFAMFYKSKFNRDISQWTTCNVQDMNQLFYNCQFDGDISRWDVSNVRDMFFIFASSKFSGDVSQWYCVNVENIKQMFDNCLALVPYWASIENYDERKKAIIKFHCTQEKESLEQFLQKQLNKTSINKL